MSLEKLVNTISPLIIDWFKTSKLNFRFPFLCGLACDIIATYLTGIHGYTIQVTEGHHRNDFVGLHIWLECEDYLIDPTHFQYETKDVTPFILIAKKTNLSTIYIPTGERTPGYSVLSKLLDRDFVQFLANIEKNVSENTADVVNIVSRWCKNEK